MADYSNLTPKQVSALRGKLKAKKRATSMRSRYAKKIETEDRKYQERLARDMKNFL